MKCIIRTLLFILVISNAYGQSYKDSLQQYKEHYKQELLVNGLIKENETKYLKFFALDTRYRFVANFTPTPGSEPFLMDSHGGEKKPFKEYGVLTFSKDDTICTLHVYQYLNQLGMPAQGNMLFIPFTDETTYTETFGGGRYVNLRIPEIKNNTCLLDFNKCYNPYCAYKDGYSCPIPPEVNRLHVAILAGEKMYAKYTE